MLMKSKKPDDFEKVTESVDGYKLMDKPDILHSLSEALKLTKSQNALLKEWANNHLTTLNTVTTVPSAVVDTMDADYLEQIQVGLVQALYSPLRALADIAELPPEPVTHSTKFRLSIPIIVKEADG